MLYNYVGTRESCEMARFIYLRQPHIIINYYNVYYHILQSRSLLSPAVYYIRTHINNIIKRACAMTVNE